MAWINHAASGFILYCIRYHLVLYQVSSCIVSGIILYCIRSNLVFNVVLYLVLSCIYCIRCCFCSIRYDLVLHVSGIILFYLYQVSPCIILGIILYYIMYHFVLYPVSSCIYQVSSCIKSGIILFNLCQVSSCIRYHLV